MKTTQYVCDSCNKPFEPGISKEGGIASDAEEKDKYINLEKGVYLYISGSNYGHDTHLYKGIVRHTDICMKCIATALGLNPNPTFKLKKGEYDV